MDRSWHTETPSLAEVTVGRGRVCYCMLKLFPYVCLSDNKVGARQLDSEHGT